MNKSTLKKSITVFVIIKCLLILTILIIITGHRRKSPALKFIGYQGSGAGSDWIGAEVTPVNFRAAWQMGLAFKHGLFVENVYYGSPAWKAGIEAGDVILRANSTRIRCLRHLKKILRNIQPGRRVRIVAGRGKTSMAFLVYPERYTGYPAGSGDMRYAAYRPGPPVNRPYPYFYFGEELEYPEAERE